MTKTNKGFGVVTLVVIIAIVLIVGGYMYYQNQSAVPVEATPAAQDNAAAVAASVSAPTGTMETGATNPGTPAAQ